MADAQIHFTGNLGNEPELKYTQDGTAVCSASVAVNKSKKVGNAGTRDDYETIHTTWYRVSWWREIAEAVSNMKLEKGQSVTIDGEVFMEEFTTRDGQQGKALNVTSTGVRAFPKRQQSQQRPSGQGEQWNPSGPAADPWSGQQAGGLDSPPF